MSMDDRDWYRQDSRQRRADAESAARPGWTRAERRDNRKWEPIPLRLTSWRATLPLKPLGLVVVFGALALMLIQGQRARVAWPPISQWLPSIIQNEGIVPVAFPENGATILTSRVPPTLAVPFTIQTSAREPGGRFVATVRDWVTNRLVATIYLEANSVTTVPLPAGVYRLIVAFGHVWGGETVLFGQTTKFRKAIKPFTLTNYVDHSVGQVIYLMATSVPNFPTR